MLCRSALFLPPVVTITSTQSGLCAGIAYAAFSLPLAASHFRFSAVSRDYLVECYHRRGPVLVRDGSMEHQARRTVMLPSGAKAGLLETAPSVRKNSLKKDA